MDVVVGNPGMDRKLEQNIEFHYRPPFSIPKDTTLEKLFNTQDTDSERYQ